MEKITILIVDDHKLIRETWSHILNTEPLFRVVGEYGSAEEAIDYAKTYGPNIIMLDVNLPRMNGLEATSVLTKISPASRILGISMHTQPTYAKQMIRNGAYGYITKNSPRQEMIHALKEVYAERKYICNEIRNILSEQLMADNHEKGINDLSQRQIEVIDLLKKGYSSKEIASALFISTKTFEVHRYNILKKLNLKNTAALINYINKNYPGKD
jgi:two-component system invasion response regulator UvrY